MDSLDGIFQCDIKKLMCKIAIYCRYNYGYVLGVMHICIYMRVSSKRQNDASHANDAGKQQEQ